MRISTSIVALACAVLAVGIACGSDDDNDNQGGTGGGAQGGTGGEAGGSGGETGGAGGTSGGTGGATGGTGGATGGSGGATGGSGGASDADCATVCGRIASADCDEEQDEAACTLDCAKGNAELAPACGAPLDALMACMETAPVACDEDGFAEFEGCGSQMEALDVCAMCVPMSQDDACEACEKEKCCSEMKALASDPDVAAYLECLLSCDNPSCPDACDAAFSSTLALMEAYAGCTGTNCASVCD